MLDLDRHFGFSERGSDLGTELRAGFTTFLTMAYIAFVNPQILADAGMLFDAVFVATCLAAFSTLVMGLYANYPVALAPGMGLNAFFSYVVVLERCCSPPSSRSWVEPSGTGLSGFLK